jgi:hypothetical protein
MHIRQITIFSIVILLSFGLTATTAFPQTKATTTNPLKKLPPVAPRTIPSIKCTDRDSMVACKSFKQLVEARDERIVEIILGTPSKYYGHVAYVCLAQNSDKFTTVDFNLPNSKSYSSYSFYQGNESVKKSDEQLAFLGPSTPNHPVDPSVQDQWFNEHMNQEVYKFGSVDVHEYRNGLREETEWDYGKWSRPSEDSPARDAEATFEGAYVWLARHTGIDKDAPDIGDDPEHAHITIGGSTIYVHYRFQNNNGGNTDYRLIIQKSTGRFTETFTPLDREDVFEHSGTCMIFKK